MATTDLTKISDEEFQAEAMRREQARMEAMAAQRRLDLQPLADAGIGGTEVLALTERLETLQGQLSPGSTYFTHLHAAVVGLRGLENSAGAEIRALGAVAEQAPAEQPSGE